MIKPIEGSVADNRDNSMSYDNGGTTKRNDGYSMSSVSDLTTKDNNAPNPYNFTLKGMNTLLHRNLIFDNRDIQSNWYTYYNRYGWINLLDNDLVCKEYIFFTKPDLFIFRDHEISSGLNDTFGKIPFFKDAYRRNPLSLAELQYSVNDIDDKKNPFMHLLSNYITSRMDLPAIQSESNKSTPNDYGVAIDYRSHSFKSDHAYDFALSFKDTQNLDVYILVKAYDEYMRMSKMGEINFNENTRVAENFRNYMKYKIIPEQFSVYKFLVGSDGETILYYAKATGVYFTDVPRADFSDPGNDGFKFSVSFHTNFIQDMDPLILSEFDALSLASYDYNDFLEIHDGSDMNNEPAKYARVVQVLGDKRVNRRAGFRSLHQLFRDYRLKWTNIPKSSSQTPTNVANNPTPVTNTITPVPSPRTNIVSVGGNSNKFGS